MRKEQRIETYLPKEFLERMKSDLGSDFPAFLESYEQGQVNALRLNPLKCTDEAVNGVADMLGEPVPWCPTGYYYNEGTRPGRHPLHAAGLYYMQDASAMQPVEWMGVRAGERVLDLCAAPGGKSTQIAGKLMGRGLLVCNEPVISRAKILSENIERCGIANALVISEMPHDLVRHFPRYFHRILVDAPCSGEGMFRKNPQAAKEWSPKQVAGCAARQDEILDEAYEMLMPGGTLVYSTCTFAREEDEGSIERFQQRHSDMRLLKQRRMWPHQIKGEGHYAALLEKAGKEDAAKTRDARRRTNNGRKAAKENLYQAFLGQTVTAETAAFLAEHLYRREELLYRLPDDCPVFDKIHVLRAGLFLGSFKKGRFEPSHALALFLKGSWTKSALRLRTDSEEIRAYLRGEALAADVPDGWTLIMAGDCSLGWGKASGGMIKNHYPKGLRVQE